MVRIRWERVLEHAAAIVTGYDTGVTLRQLFYWLVADETLPNTHNAYKSLSAHTAAARRAGGFPALLDRGRMIHRDTSFTGPDDALSWLTEVYRRDRTEGQACGVYIGMEKVGLVEQLCSWFGELGLPVLALSGFASQSYVDNVAADVAADARPAVLLYAGDFDPSGEDIERDFLVRAACFAETVRVALDWAQVEEFDLPPQEGKASDSRARAFAARHGRLVQVELDALPPDVLRGMYERAFEPYWDKSTFEVVTRREDQERRSLTA